MSDKDLHGDERFEGGNYIDWLMNLDPLELSAQNIDDIIVINRRQRLQYESGVKPKKGTQTASLDLGKIGLGPQPTQIKRRKL